MPRVRTNNVTTTTAVLRRLEPTCEMPTGPLCRQISAEQMQRLRRRITEPVEAFVDPSFRSASAEAAIMDSVVSADELAVGGMARRRSGSDDELDVSTTPTIRLRAMTGAEERAMFIKYNYCRYRVLRIMKEHDGARLSLSAARDLLEWDQRAADVRDLIIQANLGLVPTMVERSRVKGVDFGDLISEGQLALLRSVEKFDYSRGFKFSTYACRSILTAITRSIAMMARHRARFPTEFDPDMQGSDVVEAQRAGIELDCLDEIRRILRDNSAELTRVERRVLSERFGIRAKRTGEDDPQRTLRQVADKFGVTKERVRQIQNKALNKIRTVLSERVLID